MEYKKIWQKVLAENFLFIFSLIVLCTTFITGLIVRNYNYLVFSPIYLLSLFSFYFYFFKFNRNKPKSNTLKIVAVIVLLTLIPFYKLTLIYTSDFLDSDTCLDHGGVWDLENKLCLDSSESSMGEKAEVEILIQAIKIAQKGYFDSFKFYSNNISNAGYETTKNIIVYFDSDKLPEVYKRNLNAEYLPILTKNSYKSLLIYVTTKRQAHIWYFDSDNSIKYLNDLF